MAAPMMEIDEERLAAGRLGAAAAASPTAPAAAEQRLASLEQLEFFKAAVERRKRDTVRRNQQYEDASCEGARASAQLDECDRAELAIRLEVQQRKFLRSTRSHQRTNDFEPLAVLGAGAFGVVRLVRHRVTRRLFSLKESDKQAAKPRKNRLRCYQERRLLAKLQSPQVVRMYGTFQDGRSLYQILEYLPGGDLMVGRGRHATMPSKSRLKPKGDEAAANYGRTYAIRGR
eukprot:GHVT01018673.1.p2 GENE.GHVT01018673.1~~GHVT01018673.1.p2  ORF type:complete len:231 (+),score=47.67 GHVT01018673.1:1487-2179(+)